MSDLISRQAAIDALEKDIRMAKSEDGELWVAKLNAQLKLTMLPTIEPKHGRWIWNKRLGEWYCSNCDRIMTPYTVEKSDGEYEMAQPFYCGWCGAKMDESTTSQVKERSNFNGSEEVGEVNKGE